METRLHLVTVLLIVISNTLSQQASKSTKTQNITARHYAALGPFYVRDLGARLNKHSGDRLAIIRELQNILTIDLSTIRIGEAGHVLGYSQSLAQTLLSKQGASATRAISELINSNNDWIKQNGLEAASELLMRSHGMASVYYTDAVKYTKSTNIQVQAAAQSLLSLCRMLNSTLK